MRGGRPGLAGHDSELTPLRHHGPGPKRSSGRFTAGMSGPDALLMVLPLLMGYRALE